MQTWEIAHLGIKLPLGKIHLGSCRLGKYTWEVVAWKNTFGKLSLGKIHFGKCRLGKYSWEVVAWENIFGTLGTSKYLG